MALTVDLGRGVTLALWPDRLECETRYLDGHVMAAQRLDTAENRAQAAEQGYTGERAVWRSLVEHEALHTLVGRALFGRESLVLRHECGAEPARYALRLHEEAVVLSLQRVANGYPPDPILTPFQASAPPLPVGGGAQARSGPFSRILRTCSQAVQHARGSARRITAALRTSYQPQAHLTTQGGG